MSPAVHIRRLRIDYESHVAHLDRNRRGCSSGAGRRAMACLNRIVTNGLRHRRSRSHIPS
jgi:hypothetical protein